MGDFRFFKDYLSPQSIPKAKPDGWLSGDEALARYAKSPDTITKAVEVERAKHLKCATDEKRLRCDVERILDAKICYLEFTCAGCGMAKRIQVNELNGVVAILKETYPPKATKEEKIAANVKANAEGRVRYPQIVIPPSYVEQENRLIRDMQYRSSAMSFTLASDMKGFTEGVMGAIRKTPKPKPEAKPKPIDRLRIVRAAPAHDEEV